MKRIIVQLLIIFACGLPVVTSAQNIAVNATGDSPDNSAVLDVQSTDKGLLIPRMSTAQRTAIAAPATGLLAYDVTTGSFWFKNASRWVELIDSTNTIWTKKDTSVYLNNRENVGIGTTAPAVRLQISNGTDAGFSSGGFLQLGSTTLKNLSFDNNEIQARNNGVPSDMYMQVNGGNIGIGTSAPQAKLEIDHGIDVGYAAGGYLQLGPTGGDNVGFDNNEIQARSKEAVATLYLQNSGGNIQVGSASNGAATTDVHINNGKIVKPATGGYNMMPLCYGSVAANGTIYNATPNVTVTKGANGRYFIKCAGIGTTTTTLATLTGALGSGKTISLAYISSPSKEIEVFTYDITLAKGYDTDFSFVFYNP